jgi:hypothetical protein
MPIRCKGGQKPRYRVKSTKKGKVRLAFCGNKAVEARKMPKKKRV